MLQSKPFKTFTARYSTPASSYPRPQVAGQVEDENPVGGRRRRDRESKDSSQLVERCACQRFRSRSKRQTVVIPILRHVLPYRTDKPASWQSRLPPIRRERPAGFVVSVLNSSCVLPCTRTEPVTGPGENSQPVAIRSQDRFRCAGWFVVLDYSRKTHLCHFCNHTLFYHS